MTNNQTTYFVVERRPCEECEGTGTLQNLYWTEFHRRHDRVTSQREIDKWFWTTYEIQPPDEEETCYNCDGKGWIERTIDLLDALRALDSYGIAPWSKAL